MSLLRKALYVGGCLVALNASVRVIQTGVGVALVLVVSWVLFAYLVVRAAPGIRKDLAGLRGSRFFGFGIPSGFFRRGGSGSGDTL